MTIGIIQFTIFVEESDRDDWDDVRGTSKEMDAKKLADDSAKCAVAIFTWVQPFVP